MNKTIEVKVTFATVKAAEEAQAKALAVRDSYERDSPAYRLWEDIYTELYAIYEEMWEAKTFGGTCSCCGTSHGEERDCRDSDRDDQVPGYMRSDRYQL